MKLKGKETKNIVVVGCYEKEDVAKGIAKMLNADYLRLKIDTFPDNEIKVTFPVNLKKLKNKTVFLIQSYFNDINKKIIETLLAFYTLKQFTNKVVLVALYFPYLRQDKVFNKGEAINAEIIPKLFADFNMVVVIDPHLHRLKKLRDFFPNAKRISVTPLIAEYIKRKKFSDYILIGPDQESEQWVSPVAKELGRKFIILHKERISPKKVRLLTKLVPKKEKVKTAIIIDDIISTGDTMIQAIKQAKKIAKNVYCIGIHGIFVDNALKKLQKYAPVVTTNTIPSSVSSIDIANYIASEIESKLIKTRKKSKE